MKLLFLFIFMIILSGCEGMVDDFLEEHEDSFKSSYKESFMKSCVKPEENEEKNRVCACLANHLIENFSVKELRDEDAMVKYVKNVAIKKCMPEQPNET